MLELLFLRLQLDYPHLRRTLRREGALSAVAGRQGNGKRGGDSDGTQRLHGMAR